MKTPIKKMAYLCILMLTGIVCNAQYDWWPIHPGQVNYYSLDTSVVATPPNRAFGMYITDSQQLQNETRYYFNKYFQNGMGKCEYGFDLTSSPFGNYQLIDSSGAMLFTYHGTPIYFSFEPSFGDTVVSLVLSATQTELHIVYAAQNTMDIFGTTDSVRIYYVLTEPMATYYDSLILSKNYGLIRTPVIRGLENQQGEWNIYRFRDWEKTGTLQLAGNSQLPENPIKPLTYQECGTYQVGDIRHIEHRSVEKKYRIGSLDRTTNDFSISIQEVMTKTENPDSIIYLIKNETFKSKEAIAANYYNYHEWTEFTIDTEVVSKKSNPWDIIPGTLIFDTSLDASAGLASMFYYNTYANNIAALEVFPKHFVMRSYHDSCYEMVPDAPIPSVTYFYLKNLGGAYYKGNTFYDLSEVGFEFERNLIYYSNSTGTWGTPYPFPLGLKKNTGDKTSIIQVYPIPANEQFTIASKDMQSITITDITGRVMYENQHAENCSVVDCSTWPAGVYFVKWFTESHQDINKIIIQH